MIARLSPLVLLFLTLTFAARPADASPISQPDSGKGPAVTVIKLQEFESMRRENDAVVLDVRTPKEFAAGHVPGAVNIDWHSRTFNDDVAKLDKSKKYLVHCLAGGRSAAATTRMAGMEFLHLYDFSGGWSEYAKAGLPVEK